MTARLWRISYNYSDGGRGESIGRDDASRRSNVVAIMMERLETKRIGGVPSTFSRLLTSLSSLLASVRMYVCTYTYVYICTYMHAGTWPSCTPSGDTGLSSLFLPYPPPIPLSLSHIGVSLPHPAIGRTWHTAHGASVRCYANGS